MHTGGAVIDYKVAPRDSSGGRSDLFWKVFVIFCCGAGGRGGGVVVLWRKRRRKLFIL